MHSKLNLKGSCYFGVVHRSQKHVNFPWLSHQASASEGEHMMCDVCFMLTTVALENYIGLTPYCVTCLAVKLVSYSIHNIFLWLKSLHSSTRSASSCLYTVIKCTFLAHLVSSGPTAMVTRQPQASDTVGARFYTPVAKIRVWRWKLFTWNAIPGMPLCLQGRCELGAMDLVIHRFCIHTCVWLQANRLIVCTILSTKHSQHKSDLCSLWIIALASCIVKYANPSSHEDVAKGQMEISPQPWVPPSSIL